MKGRVVVRERRGFEACTSKLSQSSNPNLALIILLDHINEMLNGVLAFWEAASQATQVEGNVLGGALKHELASGEDDEVVYKELDSGGGLVDGEDDGAATASDVVDLLDHAVGAGGVQA